MPFKPINDTVSREDFDDASAQGFSLSSDQIIRDGRLVLRGTPAFDTDTDLNWQNADYSAPTGQTSQFIPIPGSTAPGDHWIFTSDRFPDEAAVQDFPFKGRRTDGTNELFFEERSRPFYGGGETRRERRVRVPVFREADGTVRNLRQALGRKIFRERGRSVLDLQSDTSQQVNYVYQGDLDETGSPAAAEQSFWPDNADNSVGWTLEIRAKVPVLSTRTVDDSSWIIHGTSEITIDDGTRRVELLLNPKGIFQRTQLGTTEQSEYLLAVPWDKDFRKVRIAAQGDNMFLLSDAGQAYIGTSMFTSASTGAELKIGHMNKTAGIMLLDYVYQSHLGMYLDVEDDISYQMSTTLFTTTTPSLKHERDVDAYVSALIQSVPPYTGGTTQIQTQYTNTSNPTWTNFGTPVTLDNEYQEIDLSTLTPDGDGSDDIRFQILHQAASTSEKPAPVEAIVVHTAFDSTGMRVVPEYGPTAGGNTVTLHSDGLVTFAGTDDLYVQGVQVPGGDINHISTSEKTFVVPDGQAPGIASVRLEDIGANSYFTDRPYRYIEDYDRAIDRYNEIGRVCGTLSAFRLKNEVPDGEANLAYISSPGIEAESHVGLIDLSYIEEGNIIGGVAEAELLDSPSGSGPFTYGSPPATEELVVSASSSGWRELGVPSPLYYKYLIGRGRYYVRVEQETLNLEELRDSINVHLQDGTPILLEDYPWDILVSTTDIDGATLPEKTYSVVLLTHKKFLPGKTVFITTTVSDRSDQFRLVQGHTEVVNPDPIVLQGASAQGFDVTISPDGSFQLEIRP